MADYVIKKLNHGTSLDSARLDSQIILSDMRESLSTATQNGILYDEPLTHGNWEFIIKKSKSANQYDAVIHAMYKK